MRLYNSLTKQIEELVPRNGKEIKMFVCGPTVYDYIHIGNARTFTIFDVVAKWLRRAGYDVQYIQNITDIDDRIIKRAAEANQDPHEYARFYAHEFRNDMQMLFISSVDQYASATDHIPQVIAQVKKLIATEHVYLIEGDGWYFDLKSFSDYGKLSGRTQLEANDAVSRIDENDKKRNPGDFCVWKLSKPGEPVWQDAELGDGRPGWHIEDTAITEHYFGPQYDIHGGGMDLKFPHHEAEIAQQESASGQKPFVKYWMHAGFLENKSEKMSKSLGNFLTLRNALQKYDAAALRFYFLSNHYRSPLDFSDKSLATAEAAIRRIDEVLVKLNRADLPTDGDDSAINGALDEARHGIEESMNDDFNTPAAFASIFNLVKTTNKALTDGNVSAQAITGLREFFLMVTDLFGIVPFGAVDIPEEIQKLVDERQLSREQKDWTISDQLRDRLNELGWTVDDTPYGPLVKKKQE